MAVDTHGIQPSDVLAQLGGVDTSQIVNGRATNVQLTDIFDYIETGAGIMTGVFSSVGASVNTDEAEEVWRHGVIAYAKARVYERLNRMDASRASMSEHTQAQSDARRFPNSTGGTAGLELSTNVDVNEPFKKHFALRRKSDKDGGFRGW